MLVHTGTSIVFRIALAIAICLASNAGSAGEPRDEETPRLAGGEKDGNAGMLTDAQKEQVKAILAGYDAKTLTADQAKAIHEAFRQAGVRGGPATDDVVKGAGFDPNRLRDLAPPPDRSTAGGDRPLRPQAEQAGDQDKGAAEPQENSLPLVKDATQAQPQAIGKTMVLRSHEVMDGGNLPVEFTGDGAAATLPLEWSGAPEGTKSFALIMHHVAPDKIKWYWILDNIPADTMSLPKNAKGIGTLGNNSVNGKTEYAPPHSKGPGPKTYIYTIYALSEPPKITVPPSEVDREVLLEAMKGLILGQGALSVVYSRPEGTTGPTKLTEMK